jgi:hypothetical protein
MASPLLRPSLRAPRTISALALTLVAISVPPARAAEPAASDPYSGTYDVLGTTVDTRSGDTRRIEGHIVLTRKNGHYAAAAELETDFPTHGGALRTDVIGTGNGKPSGKGLAGSAETQLVMQTVPGVDTGFAFIPRQVGPRLVSTWVAHLETDGTLLIELTNQGAKGETYSPTKTTLRGKRVQMPQEPAPKP